MNPASERYGRFALVREMWQTADIIAGMDADRVSATPVDTRSLLFTGEGSSRIFPGKHAVYDAHRHRYVDRVFSETAANSIDFPLSDETVFVASNSGRTGECVRLIRELKSRKHRRVVGVTVNADSPVARESDVTYLLSCGAEQAVAATKSVVEQALYYDILLRARNGRALPDLADLSHAFRETVATRLPEEVVVPLVNASLIYFAGRNDGVAEEIALKTNEIARKKSDFLEGTYAVHGIEEVMDPLEAMVLIEPLPEEEAKFRSVLAEGVGMPVVAISTRDTLFPTLRVTAAPDIQPYLLLAAGWNLLVELGVRLAVDLDKPVRARKIGNEFSG